MPRDCTRHLRYGTVSEHRGLSYHRIKLIGRYGTAWATGWSAPSQVLISIKGADNVILPACRFFGSSQILRMMSPNSQSTEYQGDPAVVLSSAGSCLTIGFVVVMVVPYPLLERGLCEVASTLRSTCQNVSGVAR